MMQLLWLLSTQYPLSASCTPPGPAKPAETRNNHFAGGPSHLGPPRDALV